MCTVWFTFSASLIISSVNEQEAWTFGKPRKHQELQDRWDARGCKQNGPVLFFTQHFSGQPHRC